MTSVYKTHSPEEREHILSQFLVSSWSYSKVTSFARNEKAFEMNYIFNYGFRSSATTVAGSAYHKALESYFGNMQRGVKLTLVDLEIIAFEYIDNIPGNSWKLQKTTPTVEDCKKKATTSVTALIRNFFNEISVYEADIEEVMFVEIRCEEYVMVNGVEIPLPCHCIIDLIFRSKSGLVVICDHKSKTAYTSEDEVALTTGIQAITYVKCVEEKYGITVDEVWFVENKFSQNKDGKPQLCANKITIAPDTRALYEALLYEPLRRMVSAVNDPDYVYLINDSDNFVDRAELYDFWAKTMISEVEDFNVDQAKKDLISKRLKKIRDASVAGITPKVIKQFRENAATFIHYDLSSKDMAKEQKIEHALRSFGVIAQVAHTFEGYSSNTYLLEVQAGIKVASIHKYKLDIANALDVSTVRIPNELVIHNGTSYLSIDIAKKRDRDLIYDASLTNGLKIPVGKDNFDNTIIWDLDNHSTPHALVCGATGSGKSVFLFSTLEYAQAAGVDEIIVLDPKHEFKKYRHTKGVVVINDIEGIEGTMAALVDEMQKRVQKGEDKKVLVIFDEFADALAQSRKGSELDIRENVVVGHYKSGLPKMALRTTGTLKSLEENLRMLLQKGRSTGFRIVAATQRASVKVITGDAKVNFPVQICFRVPKEVDSKVVIDEAGAESLSGMGDGLMKSPEYSDTVRFQAFYKPN